MDFIVFSHLRWDFVYQRPQHLISRFAKHYRVWFFEEPVFDSDSPRLDVSSRSERLSVVVPHLPAGRSEQEVWSMQQSLLDQLLSENDIRSLVCWYYNPMARHFTGRLAPTATVYDCMDELSAFRGAPPGLCAAEQDLFRAADVVFTGGQSLYESKKHQHPNVHAFPSSIESSHFRQARETQQDPLDQQEIPHPRIGFAGVIDERLDIDLLAGAAALRPDWHFVMLGPVVKISPEALPKADNIHYLGSKNYNDLPRYMAGWEIGMLPFARNEATRFISPTKTPEYLAAGLPVVSTSIRDVIRPYGELGLVEIADEPAEFVAACERLLPLKDDATRLQKTDEFLAGNSWDETWERMNTLLSEAITSRRLQQSEGMNVSV